MERYSELMIFVIIGLNGNLILGKMPTYLIGIVFLLPFHILFCSVLFFIVFYFLLFYIHFCTTLYFPFLYLLYVLVVLHPFAYQPHTLHFLVFAFNLSTSVSYYLLSSYIFLFIIHSSSPF